MAGAEKILEKIQGDARQQAAEIKREAEEKAAAIISAAEDEAAKSKEKILKKAKETAEEHRRRIRIITQLEGRKAVLQAKEDMLEEVFAASLQKLRELDAEAYRKLLRPMLLAAITTGDEEIIISPEDKERITPEFIESINQEIKDKKKGKGLTLSRETRPLNGGFVLRSGHIEINNSFAALLRQHREELEPAAADILFPEEEGGLKEANADD